MEIREEKERIQIGKEAKILLFEDVMILYLENPKRHHQKSVNKNKNKSMEPNKT